MLFDVETRHLSAHLWLGKQAAKVQATGLPVRYACTHIEQVGAANQVVKFANAQLRHDVAHFFGDKEEVVHQMLGLARELGAQHRVLCRHANRAGVEVAFAHHHATLDHQRRGGKAKLVGTQQRANGHIAASFHLAVGLHPDASAQAVEHQRLLGFGQANFPRTAAMFDGRPRRSAGAAVVAGNHHVVGFALGHASSNGADADFRHQLDADAGVWRDVFQVVDQLRQVFNRINIVVRRRRDQADTGHAVAQFADVVADLATGQLAAFAGLGALGHLDLDLVGAAQILCRDTKAARGHLLDAAAQRIAIEQRQIDFDVGRANHAFERVADLDRNAFELVAVARSVFAALAGVAFAANAVHGDGQRGVGFGADRSQRHGSAGKALDDVFGRFDLVDGNGLGRVKLELKQAAQRHLAQALVVDQLGVFLVGVPVVGAGAVLQFGNGVGRPHVLFAARAPCVFAAHIQPMRQQWVAAQRGFVHPDGFFGNFKHANALDAAGGAGEVFGHGGAVDANRLKQLRAAVAHVGADTHLGHDFGQALANRLDVIANRLVRRQRAGQALVHGRQRLQRQVGVNRFSAITRQHGKVVYLARRAGLDHQARRGAQPLHHQMLVNGRQRQQRRNSHLRGTDAPVADDQNVGAAANLIDRLRAQRGQLGLDTRAAPVQRVGDVDGGALELSVRVFFNVAQLGHGGKIQHRLAHFQAHRRVDLVDVQQIGLGTNKAVERHDDGLADRVDRRVGHLRKQLLKVAVQRLVFARKHGQRAVVAHRTNAFFAVLRHRCQQKLHILLRGAKGLLAIEQGQRRSGHGQRRVQHDAVELDAQVFNPLLVGLGIDDVGLELLVVNHAALLQVDQQHLARLQAPFAHNAVLGHRQHAGLGRQNHQPIVGDAVARRAQAIAVQRGTNLAAIGKDDGGRAVPRLNHRRVVLVKRAPTRIHGGVLLPRLRDHHHHCLADGVAGHGQQL